MCLSSHRALNLELHGYVPDSSLSLERLFADDRPLVKEVGKALVAYRLALPLT